MPSSGITDLLASKIGLGLAALGRPGYINLGHADDLNTNYDIEAMQQHTFTVLDAAWAAGVRYFDAARSYGRGEAFLGSWLQLRKIDSQSVTIGSKWGYIYTADWQVEADKHEIKDHTLPVFQQQWVETQANLGHYLDVYQIHSATFESGVLENVEVLDELARLKADVGVKIGLSLSGPNQADVLDTAMGIQRDGVHLFDSVQITWNILETSSSATLQAASDVGMGVIVKEALANGRLTPRNTNPEFAEKMQILQSHTTRLNTTIDALALAYVLHQPWASVVLSGAARIDHLESNMQAATLQLDDAALGDLNTLNETPTDYWHTRSSLAWN